MIERTDEKDLLVSYDKTGRDKKTEAVLSVNGMSVVSSRQRACFSHGKLYYILTSEKTQYLYYVQVGTNTQPQFIKRIFDCIWYKRDNYIVSCWRKRYM